MRNECENEIKEKEHIKISIRPNDKIKDIFSTIKIEAKKNGYDICEVKEKDLNSKATDIVPWNSNWIKSATEGNINLKKRLKNSEKEPEPEKIKLPKDQ
jgi:hypothetical protein